MLFDVAVVQDDAPQRHVSTILCDAPLWLDATQSECPVRIADGEETTSDICRDGWISRRAFEEGVLDLQPGRAAVEAAEAGGGVGDVVGGHGDLTTETLGSRCGTAAGPVASKHRIANLDVGAIAVELASLPLELARAGEDGERRLGSEPVEARREAEVGRRAHGAEHTRRTLSACT